MIKVGLFSPNFEDGTSFYRAGGPLSALKREVDTVFLAKWTAATTSLVDVVLLQRPYDDNAVQIAQLAKLAGVPLWVDYDDDVTQVGISHPFSHVYNSHSVKANVQTCLALADVVTVSTEHLAGICRAKTKSEVIVCPNALDFNLPVVKHRQEPPAERNPVVLFRGSASHEKDVLEVSVELIDVLRDNPSVQFHCMGYLPWFVVECIPATRWQFTPWLDPYVYFQKLCELKPLVVIHPLEITEFNKSKSNCSWLEATVAGSPFITRNLPEFQKPGVLTYNTPGEFKEALEKVIKGEYPTKELVDKSWQAAKTQYSLQEVNRIRMSILQRLLVQS